MAKNNPSELERLKEQVEKLEEQLREQTRLFKAKEKSYEELASKQLEEFNKLSTEATKREEEDKNTIKSLKKQLEEATSENKKQLEEATSENKKLEIERDEQKELLRSSHEEIDSLQSKNEELIKSLEEAQAVNEAGFEEVAKEMKGMWDKINMLKTTNEHLLEENKKLKGENQDLRDAEEERNMPGTPDSAYSDDEGVKGSLGEELEDDRMAEIREAKKELSDILYSQQQEEFAERSKAIQVNKGGGQAIRDLTSEQIKEFGEKLKGLDNLFSSLSKDKNKNLEIVIGDLKDSIKRGDHSALCSAKDAPKAGKTL